MGIRWQSGVVADELMCLFVVLENAGDATAHAVHQDMLHTLPGGAREATGLDIHEACLHCGRGREDSNG